MKKYAKAWAAVIVPVLGLGITYGLFDEAQAHQLGVTLTAVVEAIAVFWVKNG